MSFPSRDNVKPKYFRRHSSAAKNHEFRLIWIKHSAIIETLVGIRCKSELTLSITQAVAVHGMTIIEAWCHPCSTLLNNFDKHLVGLLHI